jgi:hypothetical protein
MINETLFNQIVSEAKAKTNDPKWIRAIEKASAGILDGSLIVTVLAHGAIVTGKNGSHHANGACDCEAAKRGHKECYHRAAARLMHNYEEAACKAALPAEFRHDVATTPRKTLIVEITAAWPREWPPMADELVRRFRVNTLDYLADDMLKAIRLAIAA